MWLWIASWTRERALVAWFVKLTNFRLVISIVLVLVSCTWSFYYGYLWCTGWEVCGKSLCCFCKSNYLKMKIKKSKGKTLVCWVLNEMHWFWWHFLCTVFFCFVFVFCMSFLKQKWNWKIILLTLLFSGTAKDGWISGWPGHSTVWQLVRNLRNVLGMRTVLLRVGLFIGRLKLEPYNTLCKYVGLKLF